MKKNSFLTFICACIPGFGQMYLGYMKRGLSLCAAFWVTIFISIFFNTGIFLILLPVIWAYAFFDTFNIRNLTPEQLNYFPDKHIFSIEQISQIAKNFPFFKNQNFSKISGIVLIFIGCYAGYQGLLSVFSTPIYNFSETIWYFLQDLPSLIIFALIILLGIYMLSKNKKPVQQDELENNFTPPTIPENSIFSEPVKDSYVSPFQISTTQDNPPTEETQGE